MTLGWPWPILRQGSILVPWAFDWEKLKFFIFSVAILLLSMEIKLSQSLLNARGQGHLVTLAKVPLIEKIMVKLCGVPFLKNNKAKWKCISYEAKMGWKKSNDCQMFKVIWHEDGRHAIKCSKPLKNFFSKTT